MLKRQGYGQIAAILAANINLTSVGYMKNKKCMVSERSVLFLGTVSPQKGIDSCELATISQI